MTALGFAVVEFASGARVVVLASPPRMHTEDGMLAAVVEMWLLGCAALLVVTENAAALYVVSDVYLVCLCRLTLYVYVVLYVGLGCAGRDGKLDVLGAGGDGDGAAAARVVGALGGAAARGGGGV